MIDENYTGNDVKKAVAAFEKATKQKRHEFSNINLADYGRSASVAYWPAQNAWPTQNAIYLARWFYSDEGQKSFCLEPSEVPAKLKELGWI